MKPVNYYTSIALMVAISVASILFANSGLYFVYPINDRFIWLLLFTVLTTFGFYIGQVYADILRNSKKEIPPVTFLLSVIGLFPFFLVVVLFGAIGSISGLIGGLQGIIILMLAMISGWVVRRLSNNKLLTAIFQAFLLQLLIGPSGALFVIF